ncbi:MAG TPA: type IX secretion system plug protein domain-containing protein, partial [Chryseosolibacter sp.]
MKTNVLIVMCFLWSCTPLTQSSQNSSSNPKTMRFTDFAYEPQIKTIVVRPGYSDPQTYLEPAVTRLGDWNLLLEFDDLSNQRDTYYARILHCNYDWTRSALMDLDFLNDFNEFPINNFEFSVDTHIPYVHYW